MLATGDGKGESDVHSAIIEIVVLFHLVMTALAFMRDAWDDFRR